MRLVVTGGGTGGHIYPAVAVAKEMIRLLPNTKVLYMGTEAGMESSIAPREGFRFSAVRSSGVMGKSPAVAAKGLFNASRGVADAVKALKDFAPDVVLGTGGYASGPVVLAAKLLRIPRAIQEQNAVPGKTNAPSRLPQDLRGLDYSVKFFPDPSRVAVTGSRKERAVRRKEKDSREFSAFRVKVRPPFLPREAPRRLSRQE